MTESEIADLKDKIALARAAGVPVFDGSESDPSEQPKVFMLAGFTCILKIGDAESVIFQPRTDANQALLLFERRQEAEEARQSPDGGLAVEWTCDYAGEHLVKNILDTRAGCYIAVVRCATFPDALCSALLELEEECPLEVVPCPSE